MTAEQLTAIRGPGRLPGIVESGQVAAVPVPGARRWWVEVIRRGAELHGEVAPGSASPGSAETRLAAGAGLFVVHLDVVASGIRPVTALLPRSGRPGLLALLRHGTAAPPTPAERTLHAALRGGPRPVAVGPAGLRPFLRQAAEAEATWLRSAATPTDRAALAALLLHGRPDPGRDGLLVLVAGPRDLPVCQLRAGLAVQRVLLTAATLGYTGEVLAGRGRLDLSPLALRTAHLPPGPSRKHCCRSPPARGTSGPLASCPEVVAMPAGPDPEVVPDTAARLEQWVRNGLISHEQAERIREYEAGQPAAAAPGPAHRGGRPGSLVTEGLGYVGGVLVLVAAVTLAGRYWSGLGVAGRLGLVFGAALLLVVAGAAVPAPPGSAGHRLRAVSWVLAVVAFGGGIALLADEVVGIAGERVPFASALGAAALAALLWWRHRSVVQQAAFVVAVAVTVGTGAALLPPAGDTRVGSALWGWGAAWLLLGWGRVVGTGAAARAAADVCGGAVATTGALIAVDTDPGSVLALLTASLLVAVGVGLRDLVLLGVGSVATLIVVPTVTSRWFPDTLTAPLALLVAGVLLVAGALLAARRRRTGPRPAPTGDRSLSPRAAVVAATGLLLVTAAVVVLPGLG